MHYPLAEGSKCRGWHTMSYNRDFPDALEDLDSYSNVNWKRYDELRNNEENDDDICSFWSHCKGLIRSYINIY